jgi:hypothetical protein
VTVDGESFMDNNTLFYHLASSSAAANCGSAPMSAAMQMRLNRRVRLLNELDERAATIIKEDNTHLLQKARTLFRQCFWARRLFLLQQEKQNNILSELGKLAHPIAVASSPTQMEESRLFRQIWESPDASFDKKHMDLYRFVQLYCREPLCKEHTIDHANNDIDHVEDDRDWYYSKQTHSPLVPAALVRLCQVYVHTQGNVLAYQKEWNRVLKDEEEMQTWKKDTTLSRTIETKLLQEKMPTKEDDILYGIIQVASFQWQQYGRMASKDQLHTIMVVFTLLCESCPVKIEANQHTSILRMAVEFIRNPHIVIPTEEIYQSIQLIHASKTTLAVVPFAVYQNQQIVAMVVNAIIVHVQSSPELAAYMYRHGMAQMGGYPLNDDGGGAISFFASLLFKLRLSSIYPWHSLSPLRRPHMMDLLKKTMDKVLENRHDLRRKYEDQRHRLALFDTAVLAIRSSSDDEDKKTDMPKITGITEEYKKELRKIILNPHGKTTANVSIHYLHGKYIRESLSYLHQYTSLPETAGIHPLFFQEPFDRQENRMVYEMGRTLAAIRQLASPTVFSVKESSRIYLPVYPERDAIYESTIYGAFIHYGEFDDPLRPVAKDLQELISTKPQYALSADSFDKIQYMKSHDFNYSLADFHKLMDIVRLRRSSSSVISGSTASNASSPSSRTSVYELHPFHRWIKDYRHSISVPYIDKEIIQFLEYCVADYGKDASWHSVMSDAEKELGQYLEARNRQMHSDVFDLLSNMQCWSYETLFDELYHSTGNKQEWYSIVQSSIYRMGQLYPSMFCRSFAKSTPTLQMTTQIDTNNTDLSIIFQNVVSGTITMADFLQELPTFHPVDKVDAVNQNTTLFHRFLSAQTVFRLYEYAWLKTIRQYFPVTTLSHSIIPFNVEVDFTLRQCLAEINRSECATFASYRTHNQETIQRYRRQRRAKLAEEWSAILDPELMEIEKRRQTMRME